MIDLNKIFKLKTGKSNILFSGYSRNKDEYYCTKNVFVSHSQMLSRINKIRFSTSHISTVEDITVLNNDFRSLISNPEKIFGAPNYHIEISNVDNYSILFFRKRVYSMKVLTQVHIFENRILYAKSEFSYLGNNSAKDLLLESISKKYGIRIDNELNADTVIRDSNNNRLLVSDTGKIELHYINTDESIIDVFKNARNGNVLEKKKVRKAQFSYLALI